MLLNNLTSVSGDDPAMEHARWYPNCEFLLKTKRLAYICMVQECLQVQLLLV